MYLQQRSLKKIKTLVGAGGWNNMDPDSSFDQYLDKPDKIDKVKKMTFILSTFFNYAVQKI